MAASRSHLESQNTASKITRGGRKITYNLSVAQQPERARACGAGAKCMYCSIEKTRKVGILT